MASNIRDLSRRLRDQGAQLVEGGQHVKVMRAGRVIAILPRSCHDDGHRALKNVIAQCRRAGFVL